MQNIVFQMMNFQHFNNIRGAIKTNAKCLHDILKNDFRDKTIEVYPAIVTFYSENSESSVLVHLIILVSEGNDKVLFDPSYDVFSKDNKKYYLNIKDFVDSVADFENKKDELRSLAMDFLFHNEIAKQINSGSFDEHNRELYEKQREYIKLKCSSEISNNNL